MGRHQHIHRPAAPEMASCTWPLPFLDKGVTPKNYGCRFYSSQYRVFPSFSFLFRLNNDANHLLPSDLPGRQFPAHDASVNTPPDPMPTRYIHQDTQYMVWQGMWTDTVHPGGGTRRVGYHVTDRDNLDRGVLQQPAGLQHDMRCGAPISRRWSAGRRGAGVARQAQLVEERVHVISQAERGGLRDHVEGNRCGGRVRGGNIRMWCLWCYFSGVGNSNEPHLY